MSEARHQGHFFTDPASLTASTLTLWGIDAHHLKVRRARPGDRIEVGDGAGRVAEAAIDSIEPGRVEASILRVHTVAAPVTRLTVFQGLAKSGKVDWAVQKLVELGVDEVAVFAAGRSVPVWDRSKAKEMGIRWQGVAYAASKQSRRAWLPTVSGPLDRDELVARVAALPAVLVADPDSDTTLRAVLTDLGDLPEVGVVVGPEGGLTREEVGALIDAGAGPVSLGHQILRTETAGFALAAVLMHHIGRFG